MFCPTNPTNLQYTVLLLSLKLLISNHGLYLAFHLMPLSYFSFQPVLHDWCNKGRGMCYPVCGMVHIKEPLLLIDKSSLCGGSGFPFSLSEWSLTIWLTPYNRRYNVLSDDYLSHDAPLVSILIGHVMEPFLPIRNTDNNLPFFYQSDLYLINRILTHNLFNNNVVCVVKCDKIAW